MDPWLAIGIFVLGAATGALLTRIQLIGLKLKKSGPKERKKSKDDDGPGNQSRAA